MLEMMEEFDFEAEEVLLIHPEEDIRKIEAIEIDTNSNLEPPSSDLDTRIIENSETDGNSNFEPALESDIKINEVIETDSNLEEAIDLGKSEASETSTNSNSELELYSEIGKTQAFQIDGNLNFEQTLDSDSGEIDDDEEVNDLEEGEIKDSSPVSKKKSDIACRFFKRGSCAFGSQCQYLHVSDSVYKMFDINSQKRNNIPLIELHNFPKPPIFPPIVLPSRSFIEPPISAVPKTNFHRQCDRPEDTWEKGLEQARLLIRQANLKKKNGESEEKKLEYKNNHKDEKTKGSYFSKAGLENEQDFNNKKNSSNNRFRKENLNDERKSNYHFQQRSTDKWVDPWRRSKSPLIRKRMRSLSGSPPARSRKHSSTSSYSSVSSSSEIDDIYRRPYVKKSPRGQQGLKSRSRSISQSRRPKRNKISPRHYFNHKRNPRSVSRSRSHRKQTLSPRTQSRSSSFSSSSCSDCCISPTAENKVMKKNSIKLGQQISQKSPKRASESHDSDCETSEMTVSSASCTTFSSDSETESQEHISLRGKESSIQNNSSTYSNKTSSLSNPKGFNKNRSNSPTYQRKMQPFENRKNQNNWRSKTSPIDSKPKNTASYFSSVKKPVSTPKFSGNKMSSDMELLSSYQRITQPPGNSKNPNDWNIKTEFNDCRPKNTTYFSSAKKSTSAPKASGNKMSSDVELLSAYQREAQPSDNHRNTNNNFKTGPSDCKPKNTPSSFSSVKKPASAPKVWDKKLTADMELLFMYQGLSSANRDSSSLPQKVKSNNPTSKPDRTRDAGNITDNVNSESKVDNTSKKNIVLNLQPNCNDYFKPELFSKSRVAGETVTIKKETASKREQLLTKLKLIDDAIARKKCK